jgi:hypothetical protein
VVVVVVVVVVMDRYGGASCVDNDPALPSLP